MARTTEQIEESINEEAEKHNELEALEGNGSMVSFWAYAKKVVAFTVLTLERLFDQHKKDIDAIIEKTETGSVEWYLSLCRAYQHGDGLMIQNNRPVYAADQEGKRIIKRVALKEGTDATLHFKVVGEKAGKLAKLEEIELVSFKTYMSRVKIAGTKLDIDSLDANELTLRVDVTLDSLLFDQEGKLLSDDSKEPVLEAIKKHLRVFDFGGVFYLSRLTNAVMKVSGVKDFFVQNAWLNGVAFTQKVETTAGYIELLTNTDTDINTNTNTNTNINYVLS